MTPRPHAPSQPWWARGRALVAWWVVAGAALVFALGAPAVQRTQEARVLETARQMMGTGWRGWLGPMLNGKPRLRKPPLAYWMAATAYRVAGVGEGPGRFPTAVLGWLTIGVTFACGRWLFGRRAGFFAAACLLCSYLFFRYSRLAETDAPAMFFVTLACFTFWRGSEDDAETRRRGDAEKEPETAPSDSSFPVSPRSRVPASFHFHVAAASTALAILSKGPPGAYPPLFFLVWVMLRRRWSALRRFVICGAVLTLVLLAAPWFAYVLHTFGIEQWLRELDELGGQDHPGHFYQYFYELLIATAPWCPLLPMALIAALRRRRDPRLQGPLLWIAVIFLPLCLIGNKQFHYLMPLMPPLMILIGWWIDLALRAASPRSQGPEPVGFVDATMMASAVAAPAILLASRFMLGGVTPVDWALAAAVVGALGLVAWVCRRGGRTAGLLAYFAGVLLVLVPAVSFWMPKFEGEDSRQMARQIAGQFGSGPYCFYGPNVSLPLCFNVRAAIPQEKTPEELERLAIIEPDVVVIAQTKSGNSPPRLPVGFELRMSRTVGKQTFALYQRLTAPARSMPRAGE